MRQGSDLLSALLTTAIIYTVMGYQFGTGDMAEGLSLMRKAVDGSLYPRDFYVSHLSTQILHERSFFLFLLLPGAAFPGIWCLILHVLCSFFLVLGMERLASPWINSALIRWSVVLFAVILMFQTSLGSNYIYENMLAPSLPSKVLALWALVFWQERKYTFTITLIVLSSLFQPIAATQVVVLILGAELLHTWTRKKAFPFRIKHAILLMPLIAWMGYLFWYHQGAGTGIERETVILFRMPHHFIPPGMDRPNFWIYGFLFLLVPIVLWKTARRLAFFSLLIALGCLTYSLLLELLPGLALLTQWLKTGLWMDLLAGIALGLLADRWLHFPGPSRLWLSGIFLLSLTIAISGVYPLDRKPYHFPTPDLQQPEFEIAVKAGEVTDSDALFLIPPDNSTFRYWSGRSVYVDFKSIAHNADYLGEWARRVQMVYDMDPHRKEVRGFEAVRLAKEQFRQMGEPEVRALERKTGATHLLSDRPLNIHRPIEIQVGSYHIYALKD